LKDRARHWKICEITYIEREYWLRYIEACEDKLMKTGTAHALSYVIVSNHKWFRKLVIVEVITKSLEEMK
jgi:polyphosphate kinase 2 (PPK2 family)